MMGAPPAWDEVGLAIAKELAAGETTIYVQIGAGDLEDVAVGILADWQAVVPGVRLKLRDQAAEDTGNIHFGNSFTQEGLAGETFDYFLSNPPFGVEWKKVEREIWTSS
jgi:hypothetical protein